jgi:hypothetical protein
MRRGHLSFLLITWLLCVPIAGADEPGPGNPATGTAVETAGKERGDLLEWQKEKVETQVQRAARWVDSFFSDPDYLAEVASSQFRLRPEIFYREEQGVDFDASMALKLHLPNLNRKVSLVIGSGSDEASFGDEATEDVEESVIGLQFFGRMRKRWHTSLSAGLKFDEFAGYIGPRARYWKSFNERTSLRFSQAVRWQTNNYWQILSRLDINHTLGGGYMFRQTFDGRWRGEKSEKEGYRTRISSFLTRYLSSSTGLQYEFTTVIHTRPDTHVDRYTLAARFRKRTTRDWLYYEIVPQVSFENEFDYAANPGIRLRLEFFYGTDVEQRRWKNAPEDSEDFLW